MNIFVIYINTMQTLCLRKRQKITCTKIVHTTFPYDIWCDTYLH